MNNQELIEKIEQSAQLISLPEIYLQLRELLADPDYTMAEVALLVGRDPALATRFLRVVNNPLNRRLRAIETVTHAVSLLGSQQVLDIALGASVAQAFDGALIDRMSMKQFWQRSVYCAVTAQLLASAIEDMESERLFVMGLLHDIGHLFMLLAIPEKVQQANLKAQELERPLYQVERELLGFDYAQVGARMMHKWALPKSLQITTCSHPEPSMDNQFAMETALIHLSTLLVQSKLDDGYFNAGIFVAEDSVWPTTGLTVEQCRLVQQTAYEQFDTVAQSISP